MRIVIDIDPATGAAELTRADARTDALPTSSTGSAAIDAGACAGIPSEPFALARTGQIDRPGDFSVPPVPHGDAFDWPGMAYTSNGVDAGSPPT